MTPLALPRAAARAGSRALHGRGRLAKKLAVAFLGVVAVVLIVNGAINTWLTYNQARRAALEVEVEKARSAAERVGAFLSEIETQLGWTTGAEWGHTKLDQQRYDFIRLLREAPAVTALAYIDGQGKEQIAVSRLEPDSIASGKDFSNDPRFVRAVADKVWFGPVEFRRGSEPYMTIAMAHAGKNSGVTVADVNLKLVWDVITSIHVGEKGFAFVVDDHGRLIAHPDLSLVLRDSDFSHFPQVAEALATRSGEETSAPRSGMAEVAASLDGASVLTAYAIAPKTHWIVFVEQPLAEALAEAYGALWRMLALLAVGLVLALLVGSLVARRLVEPIDKLRAGAERLGAGDLSHRIEVKTGDELEMLADQFNKMADRIREGYETLEAKVAERTRDLEEALAQQTATADVLKVISRSAFDLKAVLETLVTSATTLSNGDYGVIFLREGDLFYGRAFHGYEPNYQEFLDAHPRQLSDKSIVSRAALSGRTEHIPDKDLDPDYSIPGFGSREDRRTMLAVPLLRDGRVEGVLTQSRRRQSPFTARQIELVQTFADQAVIAIENARLFNEVQARTRDLEESLTQQTATANVLKVISRSAFDLDAILKTLVSSAITLCRADGGQIFKRHEDGSYRYAASNMNVAPEYLEHEQNTVIAPGRGTLIGRVALDKAPVRIVDAWADAEYAEQAEARVGGVRGMLGVPLLRDGEPIGAFALARFEPIPFTQQQVDLVTTFADQAVIAIENARLFEEVQARTREVEEALAQQTATTDVLKVISSSAFNLQPVFETIAESAVHLCEAERAVVFQFDGEVLRAVATHNCGTEFRDFLDHNPIAPGRNTVSARAAAQKRTVHVWDVQSDPEYSYVSRDVDLIRTMLAVPMLKGDQLVGTITIFRLEAKAFTDNQIKLVETFAEQAVIAVENVRLFEQVQHQTHDLEESLAQQTATADVLKVISRSAFDLDAIFETLVTTAVELCHASSGTLCIRDGEVFRYRGMAGPDSSPDLQSYLTEHPLTAPTRETLAGRTILSGNVEQIPDIELDHAYSIPLAAHGNHGRALLGVPLLGKSHVEGALVLTRAEPGAYAAREVEILQTFADQAVIAIENARLIDEVRARTRELEASLSDLRKAQDRLVQSEKLASLGQLTAGIAHEIKNPLNFVNNFAALSRELLGELKEILSGASLADKDRDEVEDLVGTLDSNLDKVAHHGKRADSIVKNMLLHSREGSGERTSVNVNAMVEEALNLGYHGARAEKPGFNVTLEKDFDDRAGMADVHLQEITRVLLNLISNGFYAAAKRKTAAGADYEPTLKASTRDLGARVEIRIRDNGTGIPEEVRAKMFNPFFTTKPAGEGTGLGLSLSHDIIVKQHGGTIEVETELGHFTEFVITLPRHFTGAEAAKGVAA